MKKNSWKTQGQEFSLRWRRCEQMRGKGMLPNLSAAADVACWAELSFSGILGHSGRVDLRQAEKCGREDWQETEQRDLFREPLCVMMMSDRTTSCVWDGCVFKWFRRTSVLSMLSVHVKQIRVVKLDDFFGKCVCAVAGMKRAILPVA